jgi:salicylate hydroxylase
LGANIKKQIAVVGCGPAGLASALLLNRDGHDVTLFDQFSRPKPLGSGLLIQPSGQSVLSQLGLLDRVRRIAAPVTGLNGIDAVSGRRALDMAYRHIGEGVHALGIHRASLFDVLFEAVTLAGIRIRTNCHLSGARVKANLVFPQFDDTSDTSSFDLMIEATGASAMNVEQRSHQLPFAALWTTVDHVEGSGIATASLDQRYLGARKMAGIMPVGINPATGNAGAALFWSIKPGDMDALRQRGIDAWRQEFLSLWPEAAAFVTQIRSFEDLTLAIYRHRTGRPVTSSRIFHVGDSWHCTSPQLGQGANMALIDATAIAEAIRGSDDPLMIAQSYAHLRSDHVRLYQLLSRIFTPLYQSDSALLPKVRNAIIHHMARLPLVRTLIAQVVSGNFGNFHRPHEDNKVSRQL